MQVVFFFFWSVLHDRSDCLDTTSNVIHITVKSIKTTHWNSEIWTLKTGGLYIGGGYRWSCFWQLYMMEVTVSIQRLVHSHYSKTYDPWGAKNIDFTKTVGLYIEDGYRWSFNRYEAIGP